MFVLGPETERGPGTRDEVSTVVGVVGVIDPLPLTTI